MPSPLAMNASLSSCAASISRGPAAKPNELFSLIVDSDQFVQQIIVPHVSNLSFEVGGVPFEARHIPNGDKAKLILWATLGYLPFSVTSQTKRRDLITILEGARLMPHVKFGIDPQMRIVVTGEYDIPSPPSPVYLFDPLIRFLQESRGFMKLIGETL